jgi:hypothetical protein
MNSVMNNTKWEELRLAMYSLGNISPKWRTKDLSGYLSQWDGEWFYHFRNDGYDSIEWVEIEVLSLEQDAVVLEQLRRIYVPGRRIERGYRIFGFVPTGFPVDYI